MCITTNCGRTLEYDLHDEFCEITCSFMENQLLVEIKKCKSRKTSTQKLFVISVSQSSIQNFDHQNWSGFLSPTLSWGLFLESPGNFSGPKSHCKISNLAITELFSSHILKMKKSCLHTRSFRHIHFSVFRYR